MSEELWKKTFTIENTVCETGTELVIKVEGNFGFAANIAWSIPRDQISPEVLADIKQEICTILSSMIDLR